MGSVELPQVVRRAKREGNLQVRKSRAQATQHASRGQGSQTAKSFHACRAHLWSPFKLERLASNPTESREKKTVCQQSSKSMRVLKVPDYILFEKNGINLSF